MSIPVAEFTKAPDAVPPPPSRAARIQQRVVGYLKREFPVLRVLDTLRALRHEVDIIAQNQATIVEQHQRELRILTSLNRRLNHHEQGPLKPSRILLDRRTVAARRVELHEERDGDGE